MAKTTNRDYYSKHFKVADFDLVLLGKYKYHIEADVDVPEVHYVTYYNPEGCSDFIGCYYDDTETFSVSRNYLKDNAFFRQPCLAAFEYFVKHIHSLPARYQCRIINSVTREVKES